MSIRKELYSTIESMQAGADGWIVATTTDLADAVNQDSNTVSKYLNSLQQTGNLEAKKDETGRVVALRTLRAPRGYSKRSGEHSRSAADPSRQHRTISPRRVYGKSMHTPHVDEYGKAKEAFEHAVPEFNQYATAEWKGDPLAEEALALKVHNEALISQLAQIREQRDSMTRELEYLRKVQNSELRKGLSQAGVLVEHGA